ncbi:hypothetical protein [Peribacillus butanolivorans]|uniref:hypothetical protein n=1 Tax=Peribacillus butanolivorans TaxID=421767 RepID=UPI00366DCB90
MFTSVLFSYCYFITKYLGFVLGNQEQEKIYISPLVHVNLGIITHLVGLKLIRGFAGMGVSMVGAIILGISLIILVLILITDSNKKRKLKKTI